MHETGYHDYNNILETTIKKVQLCKELNDNFHVQYYCNRSITRRETFSRVTPCRGGEGGGKPDSVNIHY